jgi:hypothetical protein
MFLAISIVAALPYLIAIGYLGYKWFVRPDLAIGSSPPGGTYNPLVNSLTPILNKTLYWHHFTAKATGGSVDNIQLLKEGKLDFAVVQDGVSAAGEVRALARLYRSPMHIAVRKDTGITNITQLGSSSPNKRWRIYLGPEGSGTRRITMLILEHYGISYVGFDDVGAVTPYTATPQNWSFDDAARALLNSRLDGAFLHVGLGSAAVETLSKSPDIRLVPVDRCDGIVLKHPYLSRMDIPEGTYGGTNVFPESTIKTIATSELLVCRKETSDRVAYEVVKALYQNAGPLLVDNFGMLSQLGPVEASSSLYYQVHPGADAYYKGKGEPALFSWASVIAAIGYSGTVYSFAWEMMRRRRTKRLKLELDNIMERTRRGEFAAPNGQSVSQELFCQWASRALEQYKDGKISRDSYEMLSTYREHAESMVAHGKSARPGEPKRTLP